MEGKTINGFTLQRRLGIGGMAEVWYAENRIGKKAAVKILLPNLCADENVKSRFLTEAEVTVKLDHPNIRQVLDCGEIDGRPAIVMEYLEGEDLKARMKRGQRFTDEELKKWWNQLVSALNYTHQRGIVHRDIKPGNIFVDREGNIKLLDFGIAKVRESISKTQTGQKLGTLMYMSPEQVKDSKHIDYRTDIYSLAVTFVHLITGKKPYDSDTSSDFEISEQIVYKPLDLSGLSTEWRYFLTPYLNKEASRRPALRNFELKPNAIDQDYEDEGTLVEGTSKPQAKPVSNLQSNGQKQVESKKPNEKKKWPWLVATGVVAVAVILSLMLNGSKNYARPFSEGLAFAQINGKVGYINKVGDMVVTLPQCDMGFDFHDGLAAVRDKKSYKWGYIDKTGRQIVSYQYSNADDFSEGLAHVCTPEGEHFFIDKTGKRVVSFSYDTSSSSGFSVGDFHEGVAVVWCGWRSPEYFLINKIGEIVLELPYYHVESEGFHEGLAVALNEYREHVFINTSGQQVMSLPQYDLVFGFSDGLALVGVAAEKHFDGSYDIENIKCGYIDQSGTEIIRPQYSSAWDFSEGLAVVGINGKYGYIDKTGNVVIPLQFDSAQDFSEGLACVRKNNKCFFIDKSGNIVITVG